MNFTSSNINPKIYILLPIHNRKEITLNFIRCLKNQTEKNYRLILIDDGSTDGTSDAVRNEVSNVKILKGDGHLWWAGALQKGIDYLKSISISLNDVVLIINDDTYFEENFLSNGLKNIRFLDRAIVRATIYDDKSKILIDKGVHFDNEKLTFQKKNISIVNCLNTNGLFVKWKDLLYIGDFHTKLLPHYLSDYEFTYRAYRRGVKLYVPENVKLYSNAITTGVYNFTGLSINETLKYLFSNKSHHNPIAWSIFILLTTPKKKWLSFLSKYWLDIAALLKSKIVA
jgi:GT2 family glycosyltransferase